MRVLSRFLVTLAAIGGAALFSGCQPVCQTLCVENARYVDSCLEHWEALWADFGYDDANDYITTCQARVTATIGIQPVEDQRTVRLQCADNLSQLTTAAGCSDYAPNGASLDPTEDDNGVLPRPQ
ncbi:MAG: hypothetical protein KDA24_02045 [Deltaproteobacteria bacterium]|nr:hypothetical protein [Deltaproteobacteria bacterium]